MVARVERPLGGSDGQGAAGWLARGSEAAGSLVPSVWAHTQKPPKSVGAGPGPSSPLQRPSLLRCPSLLWVRSALGHALHLIKQP